MSKHDHKPAASVTAPPVVEQGKMQNAADKEPQVLDPKAALQGPEPVGANIEIHAKSHKVADGHFVDADGAQLLHQGKPIPQDQIFNVQSVRQEGYWKAGRKFDVVPSEVVFKSLSADQQRALLDANPTALIVTRKG